MSAVDIVIVGGGAVGLSLFSALKDITPNIVLVESRSKGAINSQDRAIGLSLSSQKFYNQLNLWPQIVPFASKIDSVQVTVKGHYGSSVLQAKEHNIPALGYVISLHQLEKILVQSISEDLANNIYYESLVTSCERKGNLWDIVVEQGQNITKLKAKWLIGVDGVNSFVRQANNISINKTEYPHCALVGVIATNDHQGQAFERFTRDGALAFLPFGNHKSAFIWTLPKNKAKFYVKLSEPELCRELQSLFGYQLGRFNRIISRSIFPLKMTKSLKQAGNGLLLMGAAALSLHPIAAQGLNLNLRTINCLTKILQREPLDNFDLIIQQYLASIEPDQKRMLQLTKSLANYVAGGPIPMPFKAVGLNLFDLISPLRSSFTQLSMGLV